jgi:hypothetical protein
LEISYSHGVYLPEIRQKWRPSDGMENITSNTNPTSAGFDKRSILNTEENNNIDTAIESTI